MLFDMDLAMFNALSARSAEVATHRKIEETTIAAVAHHDPQQLTKINKDRLTRLPKIVTDLEQKRAASAKAADPHSGAKAFLRKFGKGF